MPSTSDAGSDAMSSPRTRKASFTVSTAPVMSGTLYKERDHFRGWRPRYFVLDKDFLHYYLDKDDVTPRNTLQLVKGVQIFGGAEKVSARGTEYFVFQIVHPHIGAAYRLSADNKESCTAWVDALRRVVSDLGEVRYTSPVTDAQRLLKRDSGAPVMSADVLAASESPVNRQGTLAGIPDKLKAKVELAAHALLQGASSDAEGWVPMFEKPGVVATRKAGSGGAICVRGETVMPFTIAEIYGGFSGAKARMELDHQLQTYARKQWFSYHTGVEYLRFKPVWPTAARDFCNLSHWRLLEDGTLLAFAFSAPFPDLCPQESGLVRADLIIGGYVMRPVLGGTNVQIIVQTDLCGSIPSSVASFAAQSQPMVLISLRKCLDDKYRGKPRPDFSKPVRSSYSDVINVAKMNRDAPFPDIAESAGEVTAISAKEVAFTTASTAMDVVNLEKTLTGISAEHTEKLHAAVRTLLQGASTDAEGWEPMFEKSGVVATRKAGSGGAICVRGETVMPFTIAEIFAASSTAKARMELDSQLHTFTRVKWLSRHTGIEYMRFKPVWPTAARDFCNLTHWRLLEDGTFVTLGISIPFPDLCPEESGVVRANLILAGYVMRPVEGGTSVHIIVETDLGGSLPSSVANMAAQDQPRMLVKLRKRLEGVHSSGKRPSFENPVRTTYADLIEVTMRNKDAPYPDATYDEQAAPEKSFEQQNHSHKNVDDLTAGAAAVPKQGLERNPHSKEMVASSRSSMNLLTVPNLLILLIMPVGALYSVQGKWYSWIVVIAACLFAIEIVLKRHLGVPTRQVVLKQDGVGEMWHQFKFTVNMNRLAAHGSASKDTQRSAADAVRAVVAQATSKALNSVPALCGHIVNGYFYPNCGRDVNVIVDIPGNLTRPGVVTVYAAHNRSISAVATAIEQEGVAILQEDAALSLLHGKFPFWAGLLNGWYVSVCTKYRMTLPVLGGRFPTGVATVMLYSGSAESANSDSKSSIDNKLEASLLLGVGSTNAPISVCMGRAARVVDIERRERLQHTNDCTVVVTIDARLSHAAQCELFVDKLKLYLNAPTLLDA